VDVSGFDFKPHELTELLVALASVAKAIDVEPRLHQEDEEVRTPSGRVKAHEGLSGPTFRIRCRLRYGDRVLEEFVAVASGLRLTSVQDNDGWVRIRRQRFEGAAN
jgi:hypothetical protein